ncbi:hypothetical protein L1887_36057 [Cichorium endivia]|nr:hypothetical protein L1887_36057 [Cichorium endivia]
MKRHANNGSWTEVRRKKFQTASANIKTDESEDEDTEGSEDEDGISDTWMHDDEDEAAEGEIRPDNDECRPENGPMEMTGDGDNITLAEGRDVPAASVEIAPKENHFSPTLEADVEEVEETIINDNLNPKDNEDMSVDKNGGENRTDFDGLLSGSLPMGCFGPFPCPMDKLVFSAQPRTDDNAHSDTLGPRLRLKRRRIEGMQTKSTSPPRMWCSLPVGKVVAIERVIGESSGNTSLDLNRNPAPNLSSVSSHGDTSDSSAVPTFSREIEATVEVGNAVGFQIETGNAVLCDVMGGEGEINLVQ